jgi:hypothetical protein
MCCAVAVVIVGVGFVSLQYLSFPVRSCSCSLPRACRRDLQVNVLDIAAGHCLYTAFLCWHQDEGLVKDAAPQPHSFQTSGRSLKLPGRIASGYLKHALYSGHPHPLRPPCCSPPHNHARTRAQSHAQGQALCRSWRPIGLSEGTVTVHNVLCHRRVAATQATGSQHQYRQARPALQPFVLW